MSVVRTAGIGVDAPYCPSEGGRNPVATFLCGRGVADSGSPHDASIAAGAVTCLSAEAARSARSADAWGVRNPASLRRGNRENVVAIVPCQVSRQRGPQRACVSRAGSPAIRGMSADGVGSPGQMEDGRSSKPKRGFPPALRATPLARPPRGPMATCRSRLRHKYRPGTSALPGCLACSGSNRAPADEFRRPKCRPLHAEVA
jgi:hypothetical protein